MTSSSTPGIALSLIGRLDASALRHIYTLGIGREEFFSIPIATLNTKVGVNRRNPITEAARSEALKGAAEIEKAVKKKNIRAICFGDDDYPQLLAECEDAPLVLYVFGEFPRTADKALAIVGTRRASHYGLTMAADIVKGIQNNTPVIVSGLALGIDSAAHTAALECDLPTWAVLAHGLDTIYPSVNRSLAERIVRHGGALISEYPPGIRPWPRNFLVRNRIIAGLSHGTVVVESQIKGGAISTAHFAGSYHRTLMAIPGRPSDKLSSGCNMIIKKGLASLVEGGSDVERLLGWHDAKQPAAPSLFPDEQERSSTPVDPSYAPVLEALKQNDTLSADELQAITGLRINVLLSTLMDMELDNLVVKLPGNRFAAVSR